MDRGFYRGVPSPGGNYAQSYDRYERDERRYDDFYSDSRRGAGGSTRGAARGGGGIGRNNESWGGSNRDRGFFNQGGAGRDRGSGPGMNGQMLAALQQQQNILSAFMTNQSRGLLPSPTNKGYGPSPNNKGFGQGGGRFSGNRQGGGVRPGDKRRRDMGNASGFNKRDRKSNTSGGVIKRGLNEGTTKAKSEEKEKAASKAIEEEVPDIPDDEVDIPDSLMDNVEKLRQRKDIERNVADEDVQKLVVFCFTGKGYQCKTCGLLLNKEAGFVHHLMGKTHVMNVIDARTAKKYQDVRDMLDIDLSPDDWYEKNEKARGIILKQAKLLLKSKRDQEKRDIENYNKNPANFFTVNMQTRKSASKNGDTVTITSLVEASMEVKEFASDKFFGCEFVKAVSGFQCRLCHTFIKDPGSVLSHIDSKAHKAQYQVHLKKTPNYEKQQKEQNKDLAEVLAEQEEKNVVLFETPGVESSIFLATLEPELVRIQKLLDADKKKETSEDQPTEEEKEKEAEAGGKEESGVKTEETEEASKEDDESQVTEAAEEEHKEEEEDGGEEETGDGDETYDQTESTVEITDDVKEQLEESADPMEVNTSVKEEESVKEPEDKMPKKSILKKPAAPKGTRGGGTARRGRGRGSKSVSPATKSRARRAKEVEEVSEPVVEQEDVGDGSFLDSFQVVDEVEEE